MTSPRIQITNKSGTVIGLAGMLDALEKESIRHTVYILITDDKRRYLLQKRSSSVPNYKSYWDASAGGHVDEGETPELAAYRELKEELGLTGVTLHHAASFYFESEGDGRTYKYFTYAYTGRLATGAKLSYDLAEVEAVKFYTADQISRLDKVTPITRHIINML